ncbi:FAR1-related sequence 1 [Striga asiatica]|uniref:FAR1-related sequence 1 n=1 Tax=Striga asiatica TaxID=4170 RepID=A0A5A7QH31_STRAF|nr:FAR1-related sequence 1 [Striga asiatica]
MVLRVYVAVQQLVVVHVSMHEVLPRVEDHHGHEELAGEPNSSHLRPSSCAACNYQASPVVRTILNTPSKRLSAPRSPAARPTNSSPTSLCNFRTIRGFASGQKSEIFEYEKTNKKEIERQTLELNEEGGIKSSSRRVNQYLRYAGIFIPTFGADLDTVRPFNHRLQPRIYSGLQRSYPLDTEVTHSRNSYLTCTNFTTVQPNKPRCRPIEPPTPHTPWQPDSELTLRQYGHQLGALPAPTKLPRPGRRRPDSVTQPAAKLAFSPADELQIAGADLRPTLRIADLAKSLARSPVYPRKSPNAELDELATSSNVELATPSDAELHPPNSLPCRTPNSHHRLADFLPHHSRDAGPPDATRRRNWEATPSNAELVATVLRSHFRDRPHRRHRARILKSSSRTDCDPTAQLRTNQDADLKSR